MPARPRPTASQLQVLRRQQEKDEELAKLKAKRDEESALRALERKLQLQDKVRRCRSRGPTPEGMHLAAPALPWVGSPAVRQCT